MKKTTVTVFTSYPFSVGQKIRIEQSKRQGDWLVVDIDDRKVTLQCPISGKKFSWNRFCYHVHDQEVETWPSKE